MDEPMPQLLATGVPVSPGIGAGELHVDIDLALDAIEEGRPVVVALAHSGPADVPALVRANAVIAVAEGPEGHTAVVTRGAGVPAVVGLEQCALGDASLDCGGVTIPAGTTVLVDGDTGRISAEKAR